MTNTSTMTATDIGVEENYIEHRDSQGRLHDPDASTPAITLANGETMYYFHGRRHRDGDLPAVVSNTCEQWYKHGVRHRDFGPAIVFDTGQAAWYNNGVLIRTGHIDDHIAERINTLRQSYDAIANRLDRIEIMLGA